MDTVKIIDTQQKFANSVYLDFMSKRFGVTPCCGKDVESTNIKKQLCDWQALEFEVPEIVSITSEVFIPSSPVEPCLDTNAPEWCVSCSNNPPNVADLIKELADLNDQLEEIKVLKEKIEENIAAIELNIKSYQDQITAYDTLIATLNSQITQAQQDVAELQQTVDLKIKEFNSNCPGPEPYCSNLELEIKELQQDIAILEKQIDGWQEEKAEAEEEKALTEKLLSVEQIYLADEQEELASVLQDIAQKEQEIKSLEAEFCVDDAECVLFEVVDSNGVAVENFELYIDRIGTVLTDALGQYRHTFTDASVETDHNLQICYCFTTAGGCRQQKITLTIKAEEAEACKDLVPCDAIKITETIVGEEPAPVPPPTPLNCPLPDCEQIDELIFDQTGQLKYFYNYNDIDGYKVSSEELNTFNVPESQAGDYRAKRDAYLKSMNEYVLRVYQNAADPSDTSSITCEPLQILNPGAKYGFTNLATLLGIKAAQYGIPFELTYLEPVANLASLPPSGSQGEVIYVDDVFDYYYWDINTNSWVTDYTVSGISINSYATWSRAWRDALLKAINEFQLSLDPFNWASFYIPDFHLNKYF